jgi:hypothetical protein
MIAFSIISEVKYNNLIVFTNSQATASGLMLIMLYEEGKIKI